MLLDFVHVFPGVGSGKRCAHALFARLRSFDISSRLLATIFDGASDAQVAAKELSMLLQDEHGKEILAPSHMLRCMVHTFQLGIKAALEVISPSTKKLRTVLHTIRSRKVRTEVFMKLGWLNIVKANPQGSMLLEDGILLWKCLRKLLKIEIY